MILTVYADKSVDYPVVSAQVVVYFDAYNPYVLNNRRRMMWRLWNGEWWAQPRETR